MVSLRRRRNLGFNSGIYPYPVELPIPSGRGEGSGKFVAQHPVPSVDQDLVKEEDSTKSGIGSSNIYGSSSGKEEPNQHFSGPEIKRRKRHRRKHFDNQDPCIMRGVYFKNMKWQAAIKVDKKQIHLGTVGSQEEAARLYDRAAFMCGREPNFELSEEEKQELRQLKWEDFLALTRNAITSKKHQRRMRAGSLVKSEALPEISDFDGLQGFSSFSASDGPETQTSVA
ncbi:hypothetical protein Scep_029095 [Stephania cephalantha]|uniref:AP2/ERF domain-containing protein n=1 Tax=Stephania cephalantha TaxID=152367 RepID=A0AAP0DWY4_9MAGN